MMQKLLSFGLLSIFAVVLAACTAVDDPGMEVRDKLERGVTGQGRIVSPSETRDQYGSFYQ